MRKMPLPFKHIYMMGLISIMMISCGTTSVQKKIETDESQILKIVLDRIPVQESSDTNKCLLFIKDSLVRIRTDKDPRWFSGALE